MGLYAFSGVELQPKTFNRAVHLGPGWSLLVRATTKIVRDTGISFSVLKSFSIRFSIHEHPQSGT
jgi:hypothetical protein